MRRSNAPCGTQRNWVSASKYQKRSLIIVSSIVELHVPPDEKSLKARLACLEVRMGWEERNAERSGAVVQRAWPRPTPGCHLGSVKGPDLWRRFPGSPADALQRARSLRACTCVIYARRGCLKTDSSTEALRRAAAAHICLHVHVSGSHLSLEDQPGVCAAALEVLTSVFRKTAAVVCEDGFVCGCPKSSTAAVCTNIAAATNICIKNT